MTPDDNRPDARCAVLTPKKWILSVMQEGRWKSKRMPMRMGKRLWQREVGWREQRKPKDATMRAKCINDAALILRGLIQ
jgi:hypothetical protein